MEGSWVDRALDKWIDRRPCCGRSTAVTRPLGLVAALLWCRCCTSNERAALSVPCLSLKCCCTSPLLLAA
jgi:hypothetical protein